MSAHDSDARNESDRRAFLAQVGAGTLALLGTPAFLGAETLVNATAMDDKWVDGLKGKYRQYFDATAVNSGWVLGYAMNWLDTMESAYNLTDKDLSAVVGLRHFGIPIAYTDEIWAKYKLGEMFKINDPVTKAPAVRNPYAYAKEGELLFPGMAFEKIQARGAIFTVCNVALTVISGMSAGFAGQPKETAKQDWLAGMFKGVNVVPSGVFAVNRAQKKGCTYCYAG